MEDEITLPRIIDGLSAATATTTADGRVELVSKQLLDYLGVSLEEIEHWETSGVVHPDDLPRVASAWSHSLERGAPYDVELRVRRADGVYQWVHVRSLPLRDAQGRILRWCVLLTDIGERKRAEALMEGEKRLLEMVASGRSLPDVLEAMCALVDTIIGDCACSILLIEPDGTFRHGAGPSLPPGYDTAVHGAPALCEAGPCGTAASSKAQVIVPDLASDPRWVGLEWRALALAHGFQSVCSTPILSLTGTVLGTFAIYQRRPGPPAALLTDLVARFTHVASIAIERAIHELNRLEREHESRLLVDSIPGPVALLSPDGDVHFVNRQILEYTGQSLESLKQWGTNGTVHPEDLPGVIETFTRSIASGSPYDIVQRLRRSDGVYRWFQNSGFPVRDADGRVVRWCVLLTDIDDRKRAEDRIRESERNLKLIIDTIPGLVATVTPDGAIEAANAQLLEYTGQTLAEYKHWRTNGVVHPEDHPQVMQNFDKTIASGSPSEMLQRIRRFDGVFRWFQVRRRPLRNADGTIARWYALLTDIDDLKRAEAALATMKDQLYQENLVLRDEVDRTSMFEEIVGTSPALRPVLTRIAKVAGADSTVLITGETGTGKELVARAIHRRSARASRAFVSVNCAAVPRELIASELFGHEKGAFTGATQRRLGRFELAHGGTIFFDEVGDLPMETQVALLRVLQEREFERVGGSTSIPVDVRVVAATNRDLQAAIEAGTFRGDLFYRLNVFPITVPALRDRADDIPLLVEYFVDRYGRKAGKSLRRVNKKTLERLRSYPWPGNVRELQNVIERSVIVCDTDEFRVDESWVSARPAIESRLSFPGSLAAHEKVMIEDALHATGGRVFGPAGAAARLGMPRSTLESRIRALKIDKDRFRASSAKS